MTRKRRFFVLAAGFVTLGLFMGGCSSPVPDAAGKHGALDHVVIIVE